MAIRGMWILFVRISGKQEAFLTAWFAARGLKYRLEVGGLLTRQWQAGVGTARQRLPVASEAWGLGAAVAH